MFGCSFESANSEVFARFTCRHRDGGRRPLLQIGNNRSRITAPCDPATVGIDEVVLVRLRGNWLLHKVTAVDGPRVQIGNNRGRINGWAGRSSILGRVVAVDSGV